MPTVQIQINEDKLCYDETKSCAVPHGLINKHIVFIYGRCGANKITDITLLYE